MDQAPRSFTLRERLSRSVNGVSALFSEPAVREKAGSLLSRSVTSVADGAGSTLGGLRASLSSVLRKVQEADSMRALRCAREGVERACLSYYIYRATPACALLTLRRCPVRRRGEEDPAIIDLQVGLTVCASPSLSTLLRTAANTPPHSAARSRARFALF